MQRITIPERTLAEVELFGEVYNVVPVTKSVQAKAEAVGEAVDASANMDEYVAALAGGFDLRLVQTKKGGPRPSTVVKKAWNDDDVTVAELDGLLEAIVATDRPT